MERPIATSSHHILPRGTTSDRRRPRTRLAIVVLALAALAGPVAACSSDEEAADMTTPEQAVPQGTVLLDVRSPEEYAAGHLPGAINLNVEAEDFEQQLLSRFSPSDNYFVYCRSGNRSGVAIEEMRAAGFSGELTNLGGLEEASSQLGLPVVQ